MNTRQLPTHTLGLVVVLTCLHWLVQDPSVLYFSAQDIARGEGWRLLTGHLVHADPDHLLWNCLGLAVLGTVLEQHSRRMWWAAFCSGIAAVSLLLMTPFAQLEYYCGLSGVLNTLLLVTLWLEWRTTRSALILIIACACLAKVVVEVSLGASIMTHISWPPYAWSHVAGLAGGLGLISCRESLSRLHRTETRESFDKQEAVNQYSALDRTHQRRN